MRGRGGERHAAAGGRARGQAGFQPAFTMGNAMSAKSVEATLQSALSSGALRLANRELQELPAQIFRLADLDYQDKQWWLENEIHTLDVSHNALTSLPADMTSLAQHLRVLVAGYNRLANVFCDLTSFACLVKLDLSHNQLKGAVSEALGGQAGGGVAALRELKECDLSDNRLTAAAGFEQLPNLSVLCLANNALQSFTCSSGGGQGAAFRVLQHLDVSNNQLTELPTGLDSCRALQTLDASCNRLEDLGRTPLPASLATLNLRQNRLRALPRPLVLPQVRDLILGNNQLTAIPDLSTHAPEISFLDLSSNKLTDVSGVTGLLCLTRLDLQNNDLSMLPPRLGLIRSLTSVVLDGNPLRGVRREIVARGTPELLKFLRSRLDERENDDVLPSSTAVLESIQQQQQQQQQPPQPFGAPPMGGVADEVSFPASGRRPPQQQQQQQPAARGASKTMTVLGERNGTLWDMTHSSRGTTMPLLPETLDVALIEAAAPATFRVLDGVQSVSLAGQRGLTDLAPGVVALVAPTLTDLDVSGTALRSLDFVLTMPLQICGSPSPPNLAGLTAAGAKLSGMFDERWCTARSLRRLDVSRNALTGLPSPLFANMDGLQVVTLNHNRLSTFPIVLLRIPNLMEIHIASNGLKDVPEGVHTAWPRLQVLDVSYNELETVPFTIGLMQTLRTIKLEGNRMRWLRQSVLTKGTPKILEYLRDKIQT